MRIFEVGGPRVVGPPTLLAFLPFLAAIGCDGADPEDVGSFSVTDSAGVQIVESYAPGWGEEGPRIEAEPVLRIGQEEEGPYQFAFLTRGLLLEGGRIAIPAIGAQEVRVFDSSGTHISTFGGEGEGPGEFTNLAGLYEFSGDSLLAYDGRMRRATIFSLETGGFRVLQNRTEGNYSIFGLAAGGPLFLFDLGRGFRPDLDPGLQWTMTEILALSSADGSYASIATLPSRVQRVIQGGDTEPVVPPRWSTQAVADDGFYWAIPDEYVINFYGPEGRLTRSLRRPVEPEPIEPWMVEEYIETRLEEVRRREGEGAVPRYRAGYEEAGFGEFVPLFGLSFVDGDQRLWISGPTWPALGGPPRHWSVFSPEGVWLGDLKAPEGVRIVHARGDRVLGFWLDELDVPFVQVHRLVFD